MTTLYLPTNGKAVFEELVVVVTVFIRSISVSMLFHMLTLAKFGNVGLTVITILIIINSIFAYHLIILSAQC